MADTFNRDTLRADLRRDEGCVLSVYTDSEGYYTIGVGRLVDHRRGGGLTYDEVMDLLDNDIDACVADVENEPWYQACDTDARRRAILNMRFELGRDGIREFKTSLGLIAAKQWGAAADHLEQSLWASQVPARAARVIGMIRNG